MRRRGSVMLETVLVLPVFVFFVFFIIQAALVLTARQMTVYITLVSEIPILSLRQVNSFSTI